MLWYSSAAINIDIYEWEDLWCSSTVQLLLVSIDNMNGRVCGIYSSILLESGCRQYRLMSDVLYQKLHSLSLCICTCHLQPVCYCCISTGICLVLHCISDTFNNVHDILINSCTISDHSEIKKWLAIINSVKLSMVQCMAAIYNNMHGWGIPCIWGIISVL